MHLVNSIMVEHDRSQVWKSFLTLAEVHTYRSYVYNFDFHISAVDLGDNHGHASVWIFGPNRHLYKKKIWGKIRNV